MANASVDALRSSIERLRNIATQLSDADLTRAAYPREWNIADVLSHIGSGAVIMLRHLEDALAGRETLTDFAQSVWDTWNAKTPSARRADALAADAELLARIDAVTPEDSERFTLAMGPMTLGFNDFVGMRLNEHAFHTWDIEVVSDADATIPNPVAALVVDNLELIAGYTGKPTGETRTITIATTQPTRGFALELTPESVKLAPTAAQAAAAIELTAEAFGRLVYGRLDGEHAPQGADGPLLDLLRDVFPGP